ncbi:hypothetical protein DVH24_040618 [Malus domestica]|uniref:Uncharacterized protein n=1 Tax=Malus domestica TaxID=3750 RepID=A0A498ID15_MALDO|nr:hypothetical protein DVH24_040618 [Malus domestica]
MGIGGPTIRGSMGCVWYADGTERDGTGRNGTGRDGTGRNEGVIFEKYMGVFHRRGTNPFQGGGGTQKHPKSVPWNSPFHPFLAYQTRDGTPRLVPSRPVPRTKHTRMDGSLAVCCHSEASTGAEASASHILAHCNSISVVREMALYTGDFISFWSS